MKKKCFDNINRLKIEGQVFFSTEDDKIIISQLEREIHSLFPKTVLCLVSHGQLLSSIDSKLIVKENLKKEL